MTNDERLFLSFDIRDSTFLRHWWGIGGAFVILDAVTPMSLTISPMTAADWPAVRAIYLEGVATGQATFETDAPDWPAWDAGKLPHSRLVARIEGEIVGWAALAPTSKRPVYAGVAEVSVYVAASQRGHGPRARRERMARLPRPDRRRPRRPRRAPARPLVGDRERPLEDPRPRQRLVVAGHLRQPGLDDHRHARCQGAIRRLPRPRDR